MDRRPIGANVWREERQEQAGGLCAGREGVEFGRDLCHEFGNHLVLGYAGGGESRRAVVLVLDRKAELGDILEFGLTMAVRGGIAAMMVANFGG